MNNNYDLCKEEPVAKRPCQCHEPNPSPHPSPSTRCYTVGYNNNEILPLTTEEVNEIFKPSPCCKNCTSPPDNLEHLMKVSKFDENATDKYEENINSFSSKCPECPVCPICPSVTPPPPPPPSAPRRPPSFLSYR